MEHSALHAAQLLGMLLALAAPLLATLVLLPAVAGAGHPDSVSSARRRAGAPGGEIGIGGGPGAGSGTADAAGAASAADLGTAIARSLARWCFRGALLAGVATFLNLIVQIAEIEGTTTLAGADPALLWRFAVGTTVGRLAIARGALLLGIAILAARLARAEDPASRRGPWLAVGAAAFAAIVLASLVSHAAALPAGRERAIAVQILHLVAGAAWIGALAHLLAARSLLLRANQPAAFALVADVIRRFSPIALGAAGTLAVTGSLAAWTNLGTPSSLLTSAYGLTLIVKLVLLATLLVPAWVNYRVVRPGLLRAVATGTAGGPVTTRLGRMLEFEVTAGLLVVAVAGVLGSVSPPLPDGTGRLSAAQIESVLTPRAPQTQIVDPATWVGSETRTDDDLRYSEFMHNWSGVVVIFLGLAWLLQSVGGRSGSAVGRLWPWVLVPFAIFVGIASDPEVWPMGTVDPLTALTDPIVLEHRIGALMIIVLAWLGLRDERRGRDDRPLGRALPILMIVGSLLLLGHAHSSFGSTEGLTTLINVQHAVLGGLGLLAGVVRWLELRDLFPRRATRWIWPSLVVLVGLFMAFSYREFVA